MSFIVVVVVAVVEIRICFTLNMVHAFPIKTQRQHRTTLVSSHMSFHRYMASNSRHDGFDGFKIYDDSVEGSRSTRCGENEPKMKTTR